MYFRKIKKDEFDKLKRMFSANDNIWIKYKQKRLEQFDKQEIDIFVVEHDKEIIGEITANYRSHDIEIETIPSLRAYLEAFRIDEKYRGQGLGQKLINYCIKCLEKEGYRQFTIGVEESNYIAKHIYFKLGFIDAIAKGHGNEFDYCKYTLYLRDIDKLELQKDIETIVKKENLGDEVKSITRVAGGLSHKLYKVVTDKGIYAIKQLNSGVMKTKEAYSNFIFSETVTEIVKENGITAIGAIKLNNNDIIKKLNNKYYMAFNWLEGKTLKPEEITEMHCEIIGEVLAKIHNIDFSKIEDNKRKKGSIDEFDWNEYLKLAEKENKCYVDILDKNINLLYELNKKVIEEIEYANNNLIISHRDLDRKNVIWQEYKPFIIDWEASGYINPTIELIQVAWYFSGGDVERIDYRKFEILISTYKKYAKKEIDREPQKLIYVGICDGLEWLNYNLKRSLCIENNIEEDEIKLAESEIIQSILEIKYYVSQINNIIDIIKKY